MTPSALNYHHLLYFWAVAKEGSLRQAGEVLHISQASISAQLKQLEESLGATAFHAYDSEVNTDGYWTDRSGVRRRNIFVWPRAFDRSTPEPGQRPLRLHVGVADSVPKIIVRQHLTRSSNLASWCA